MTHLLNVGVNAAAGVVTVVAFDRPAADGLVTFAIGEAISLLTIFTQPMRAARDLKKYEAGYPAAAAAARAAPDLVRERLAGRRRGESTILKWGT